MFCSLWELLCKAFVQRDTTAYLKMTTTQTWCWLKLSKRSFWIKDEPNSFSLFSFVTTTEKYYLLRMIAKLTRKSFFSVHSRMKLVSCAKIVCHENDFKHKIIKHNKLYSSILLDGNEKIAAFKVTARKMLRHWLSKLPSYQTNYWKTWKIFCR